jgi:acetylornithine aminotransferase/acetylornithine/N-succinyldiaminopimelate aminotransferase
VLDVIEKERLMEKVSINSTTWISALKQLAKDFPAQLLGVRGRGYLVGLQLANDPAPTLAALREAGMLAPMAGRNVIRLLPPLTVTPEELAKSVEILRKVFAAAASASSKA